jgi:multiple sugar transport system substrate-binding protein
MMRIQAVALAVALATASPGAWGADLVIWWDKASYAQEEQALTETIAAFEQKTGKRVELIFYPDNELPGKLVAALASGQAPDFAFGNLLEFYIAQWAFDDQLVDLTDTVGHFSDIFDPDVLARLTWHHPESGQEALYGLPVGRMINHVHVWKSLLERAGLSLDEIPKTWEGFWSFWCDRAQPAVRKALGRDDIWGIGLATSVEAADTTVEFFQFVAAYDANYVTRDGRLVIDEPEIRRKLIRAVDDYAAIYRKGCTPPDSVSWASGAYNNQKFFAQTVVMTPNASLSIPGALKDERPDDYYTNTATIEWPLGPHGNPFPIVGMVVSAVVFKDGSNVGTARDFVRFLVAEGWLMHYLNFSGERFLPPILKLLEQPFWLDPTDPHHMAAVMQLASRPMMHNYRVASGDWRHDQISYQEYVWGHAIHRVAAEGISPEQAVDEAIARIKQILSEWSGFWFSGFPGLLEEETSCGAGFLSSAGWLDPVPEV